jgi:hypothetical protein
MPGAGRSPYRTRARVAPDGEEPRPRADRFVAVVLLGVLACSLARAAIFAFGPERLGIDPVLALLAVLLSSYYLLRLRTW